MKNNLKWIVTIVILFAALLTTARPKRYPAPDLLKGEQPINWRGKPDKSSFNVGPTGLRGWCFCWEGTDTSTSRQVLVKEVDKGSPADGKFQVGDIILGADGTGNEPKPFTSDSRITIAKAIGDAEARDPAILKLLRWRPFDGAQGKEGKTETVSLKLETMGAYSPTAPYNCEKSRKILEKGLEAFYKKNDPGSCNLGLLIFLAADDPENPDNEKYQAKAREWARALILPEDKIKAYESDVTPTQGKIAWSHSYTLYLLAEYYLKTKDPEVFPTLEAYALCFAKNQSWYGTTGHQYATKTPTGGNNGPMRGYGAINGTGVVGFLGMLLARKAGVKHPELDAAIKRSECFFASYTDKSMIPYGEHSYGMGFYMYDMNGKNATVALAFQQLENRAKSAKFFARMTMASSKDRQESHAGPFFNYMWPASGARVVGKKAAIHYFGRTEWLNDLDRRWDGKIVFSHFGIGSGGAYRNFAPELTQLLNYALPYRQLYMTGKGDRPSLHLTESEFKETVASEDFKVEGKSADQLVEALKNWSPVVRYNTLQELKKNYRKGEKKALIAPKIRALLNDPKAGRIQKAAACFAAGMIEDEASGDLLAKMLESDDSYVRFAAANGMRYMPEDVKRKHLNTILKLTAKTIKPPFPIDDDDPIQFAHYQLSLLLFYGGNAYGPRGILADNIKGVDESLLWPAVRAVARTPDGHGRGVGTVYKQLTKKEVAELSDTIIEATRFASPADAMFAGGIRKAGLNVLEKNGFAEGVGLTEDIDTLRKTALEVLKGYGGSAIKAYPHIIQYLLYMSGVLGEDCEETFEAILSDKNPRKLTLLKGIRSVVAKPAELQVPQNETNLTVDAFNHAVKSEKDNIYTWRKVYGAGKVKFTPNGTWDSRKTKVTFVGKKPGRYKFEVLMTDKLGYTSTSGTVEVTYYKSSGRLPKNKPPKAANTKFNIKSGVTYRIPLKGSDPDGDDLAFIITKPPEHGKLSGQGSQPLYRSDYGFEGVDKFDYKVVDGQGVEASGKVTLNIKKGDVKVTLYEPFDYEKVNLDGKATNAVGLKGEWKADSDTFKVEPENISFPMFPHKGGMIRRLSGGRLCTIRAPIDREAFDRDGLLKDGGVMWMSFYTELRKINGYNSGYELGLESKEDPKKNSIGSSFGRRSFRGFMNGEKGETFIKNGPGFAVIPQFVPELVVVKIIWGKTPEDKDTVEVYRVINVKKLGPTLLEKPVAIQKGIVDQSKLDTFFYRGGGDLPIDEIRIGPTYESVLLGNLSVKKEAPTIPEKEKE